MTWAQIPGNQQAQRVSEFWNDVLVSKWVKRRPPDYSARPRLAPTPRTGVANVVFSFSDLKYFFECPYHFKLRVLFGFNAPIHEGLGYGKSLHDALAEVHAKAIQGEVYGAGEAASLIQTHMHTPYAYPALKQKLEGAAERVVRDYLNDNQADFKNLEFSEKQIEINLGDGVSVTGRIDLVRRRDTNETTIVDLKSNDRAQPEDVTERRTPETGHTSLLPTDEQVVQLQMDNGWSRALQVGKLSDTDTRAVVVDMDPAADPTLLWCGKRNRQRGESCATTSLSAEYTTTASV